MEFNQADKMMLKDGGLLSSRLDTYINVAKVLWLINEY